MEERIERVLDLAAGNGFECEIYHEASHRLQIEVYRGNIESIDRSRDEGLGIRLLRDGRMGYTFSNDSSPEGFESAFEEARINTSCSSPMEVDLLAPDIEMEPSDTPQIQDPFRHDSRIAAENAIMMEDTALRYDPSIENTEGAGYSELFGEISIASTRGFYRREKRNLRSCSLSAIARRGDEIRSGWFYSQAREFSALDFSAVGEESARRASSLLGSSRIPSGRYPAVFDATAFGDIVYLIEQALSGEMVVKGTTVFAGKEGTEIASPAFTLVDDPMLEGGCFNAQFDDEGVPRKRYKIIDRGRLKGFLHNIYSARMTGSSTTGNAVRSSYRDLPSPGPSNLFIEPGDKRLSELVSLASSGIYIQNVMGMHTADPISGDFSVGINGRLIEGGEMKQAVSEMTVSGNILELLGGIREVGSELLFVGPYGAPPVLVEGLSISGI